MYFLHGALLWTVARARVNTKKQKYNHITDKKMTTPTNLLCRSSPNEFGISLNYTYALWLDDKLDYSYLSKLFHELFHL